MKIPYFSDFSLKNRIFILAGSRKTVYICSTFTGQRVAPET